MTTIKDVAALARVSYQTVSRVLNHPERVSADTRARVRDAIGRLDWRPDPTARALQRIGNRTQPEARHDESST